MKKIKEFSKKYLIGTIIGIFVFGIGGVYATTYIQSNRITYDHYANSMSSTEVQGAIDELYNTCFPPKSPTIGDTILDEVPIVTTGDGLYKDEYENRYFFKGQNPNNYITFNNEPAGWRIISIEGDGTIKIMKIDSIGDMKWDSVQNVPGGYNWRRPPSLNTYLNETYYNSLNKEAQNQIVVYNWSIGAVDNNDLVDQINAENSSKWTGKIALPTVSEYIRTNSNITCNTFSQYSDNYYTCKNTTWMVNNDAWWTLSPCYKGSYLYVFLVNLGGNIDVSYNGIHNELDVRPVLYLSSKIQITGGNGSSSNPYILSKT